MAVLVALVSVGVVGCACAGDDYAVLERPAQAADALPTGLSYDDLSSVVADSARFVGEHDGVSVWLARSTESPAGVCLLAHESDRESIVGCGGDGIRVSFSGRTFEAVSDAAPTPDAPVRVSANVYAYQE